MTVIPAFAILYESEAKKSKWVKQLLNNYKEDDGLNSKYFT